MGNENNSINPAWNDLLNTLPSELHPLVTPHLQKWDKSVQDMVAKVHSEYEELKAFQPFLDHNIDFEYAAQSVRLADEMQRNPQKVMDQMNQTFELGYVSKAEAEKLAAQSDSDSDQDPFEFDGSSDITKHPQFKAIQDSLTKLQSNFEQQNQQAEAERELQELEEYLDGLEAKAKEDNLPFHRMFVTALISQGVDGDAAVKQYHQLLAGNVANSEQPPAEPDNNNNNQPPVVMGGAGNVGSGSADGSVDFGALSNNDLNATVEQLLAQQASSGQ